MGIKRDWLDFSLNIINENGFKLEGLAMCELGNQHIHISGIKYEVAKEYFESLGIRHTSIDINGKNGALPLDLSKQITDPILHNKFDVVTNFGTSEHVSDQYQCFRNIHYFVKPGGLMIHVLAEIGNWKNHCEYYYDPTFFRDLADCCTYQVIAEASFSDFPKPRTSLLSTVLRKVENSEFVTHEVFGSLPIQYKKPNILFPIRAYFKQFI